MRHMQTYRFVMEVAKAGSIRKAAETLSITPSALNRRILALEDELGVLIFERLPRGVRLSTAGELLMQHIRDQFSDLERLKSRIADLSGIRRGHVSVACSQAILPDFLPRQIDIYRREHPGVTFSVFVRDREAAENALSDYSSDVALVFEPIRSTDFQTLMVIKQPIHAVMSKHHALAKRKELRLADCLEYPLALPSLPYGVRALMDIAAQRLDMKLRPAIQSDSFDFLLNTTVNPDTIAFQIQLGLPRRTGPSDIVDRPINQKDLPPGQVHLVQLRGRILPVAAARFADQLQSAFTAEYECI